MEGHCIGLGRVSRDGSETERLGTPLSTLQRSTCIVCFIDE